MKIRDENVTEKIILNAPGESRLRNSGWPCGSNGNSGWNSDSRSSEEMRVVDGSHSTSDERSENQKTFHLEWVEWERDAKSKQVRRREKFDCKWWVEKYVSLNIPGDREGRAGRVERKKERKNKENVKAARSNAIRPWCVHVASVRRAYIWEEKVKSEMMKEPAQLCEPKNN